MSIITGVKQRAQTYQILMRDHNNFTLNNDKTSNLINLNVDPSTYSNAVINFNNNYHFGFIDNKIIFKYINQNNNNNLLSIDNSNLNIYKDVNILSNININNLLITSNNTSYFNNNLILNLNDYTNDNINKLKILNNSSSLFEINKNQINANIETNFNSNVYMNANSTFYTNFIDSPNNKPVIINNLAFAESLRILTNNIIHNITVDNSLIWCNITDYMPGASNRLTPINDATWTKYMIDNNINVDDLGFAKPNISVLKYIGSPDSGSNIGGSNILEFKTRQLNNINSNNSNLVFSINNNGFLNIGSNYTSNIPINIDINPRTSNCYNIFKYSNKNNNNYYLTTINSNGYINIGSANFTENQLNISKNFNSNLNNTELISLNINTANFDSYLNSYSIPFVNNNDYNNFIFKNTIIENQTIETIQNSDIVNIIITNKFIENNIYSLNANFYNNTNFYSNIQQDFKTVLKIQTNIITPLNTFNIKTYETNNLNYYIYPFLRIPPLSLPSPITDFNKIIVNAIKNNKIYTYNFYIYKDNNYNYNYTGSYLPPLTDYIKFNCNANNNFSVSANGNTGIGTNYNDVYKLYIPENALINNINCSTIDNILTKNISFCNLNLNNINSLNCDTINNNIIRSSSNISSNIQVINNINVNNNLNVLNNINVSCNINISNNGIILNSNIILNNNYANIQIINNLTSPNLILSNSLNKYDICINNNNNFQILLNNSKSIIENKYNDNMISLNGSSFNIFRDPSNSNVKIFAGRSANTNGPTLNTITGIDSWYNYIQSLSIDITNSNNTGKSLFYIYGNFYLNSPNNASVPMIHSYINTNNHLKIGIGTANNDIGGSNLMIVDMNTTFNSNININNNIYLKGTILSPSDINIKTDIHIISSPLEKINKINGYTYKRTDTGNYETGLIAQEVLEILPEVVKFNNDIYNISYGNMCGLLVEAIKELNNKIKVLESKSSS
jgi:hypothetical protein